MPRKYPSYIYVVRDDCERRKVGIAYNVRSRVDNLQVGNASKLEIEFKQSVSGEIADDAERAIQRLLAAQQIRGEWYSCTADEAKSAVISGIDEAEASAFAFKKVFGAGR